MLPAHIYMWVYVVYANINNKGFDWKESWLMSEEESSGQKRFNKGKILGVDISYWFFFLSKGQYNNICYLLFRIWMLVSSAQCILGEI